jgi:hypothetical protein
VVYTEALGAAAYIGRARVVPLRNMGAALSPFNAFQILQGIETLALRMDRICDNTLAVAQHLQKHPKVGWVNYAGLPDHPDHALVQRKYLGGKASGLMTFGVKARPAPAAKRALPGRAAAVLAAGQHRRRQEPGHAPGVAPRTASCRPTELAKSGVGEDTVRLSVGIEHIDDLIADLDQASGFAVRGRRRARAPLASSRAGQPACAPIKPGLTDAQEPISYVERLQRLLDALHAARRNLRESELVSPAFPDTIGRFGVIQNFRYAVWPPLRRLADLREPGPFYLSLNVSFDGGWEPYMRVIYRDIGPFLDTLFCHCDGYPGSTSASFDDYCRWVRANELPAGIYYDDSAATPGDAHYGALVERVQRHTTPADAADSAVAAAHLNPLAQQLKDGRNALLDDLPNRIALPLRTLKGLYRLLPLFAGGDGGDALVLRRFAQLALGEFSTAWRQLSTSPLPAAQQPMLKAINESMADELAWLGTDAPRAPAAPERLRFDASALQDSMLNRADRVSHGVLALYGVRDAARARALIASLEPLSGPPQDAAAIRHLVALSWPGLQALGLPAHRLDLLPAEFSEGMEARWACLATCAATTRTTGCARCATARLRARHRASTWAWCTWWCCCG